MLTRLTVFSTAILLAACSPTEPATDTPAAVRLDLSVSKVSLYVGESIQAVATPRDQSGKALSEDITWSSTDPAVATVSHSGIVLAVGTGLTTLSASAGGRSASVAINVSVAPQYVVSISPSVAPTLTAGDSLQFTAVVMDPLTGAVINGVPVAWFVSGNGASITTSGLVRIAAGSSLGQTSVVVSASPPSTGGAFSVVVHIDDWYAYRPSAAQSNYMVTLPALTGTAMLTITCDPQTHASQAYVYDVKLGYVSIPVSTRFSGDATANIATWPTSDGDPVLFYPMDARALSAKAAASDTLSLTYNPGQSTSGAPSATFLTRGLRYYASAYLGGCN